MASPYKIPEGFEPRTSWAQYLESHARLFNRYSGAKRKKVVDRLRNTWYDQFVRQPVAAFTASEQNAYNAETGAAQAAYGRDQESAQAAEDAYKKWAEAKFNWDGSLDERGIAETEDAKRAYEIALQRAGLSYDQAVAEIKAQEPIAAENFKRQIQGTRGESNRRGLFRSNLRARNEGRDAEGYQQQVDAFGRAKKNAAAEKAFATSAAEWQKESQDRYARIGSSDRAYEKWLQERGAAPLRPAPGELGGQAPQFEPFQPTFAGPSTAPTVSERAGGQAKKKPTWAQYLKSHEAQHGSKKGAAKKRAVDKLRRSWRGA